MAKSSHGAYRVHRGQELLASRHPSQLLEVPACQRWRAFVASSRKPLVNLSCDRTSPQQILGVLHTPSMLILRPSAFSRKERLQRKLQFAPPPAMAALPILADATRALSTCRDGGPIQRRSTDWQQPVNAAGRGGQSCGHSLVRQVAIFRGATSAASREDSAAPASHAR